MTARAWRVHLPTADATCVSFASARRAGSDPWPLSKPIADLLAMGAVRDDRPHAVGAGRGIPIIHTQELRLLGVAVELRSHRALSGDDEVSLRLPPWDELVQSGVEEQLLWGVVDSVAEGCAARWGCIGDGEAMLSGSPGEPMLDVLAVLHRHIALLLPEHTAADAGHAAAVYRLLPRSGLAVLLR